jgi:hypothetical protein
LVLVLTSEPVCFGLYTIGVSSAGAGIVWMCTGLGIVVGVGPEGVGRGRD